MTIEKTSRQVGLIRRLIRNKMANMTIVLAIMLVSAATFSPYFLDPYNLQALVRDIAFISIVGLGQACLLILGEIDLSVGKIASLCGVVSGILMAHTGIPPGISIVLCVALGALLGMTNGLVITRLNLNSMVVTIGMTGLYGGINLVITKGKAITGIPESIYFLGQGEVFGLPMPFIVLLLVAGLVLFLARYTLYGRHMYAIGNNPEAAKILGIKVKAVRTIAFVIVGALSGLAGVVMVARLGTAQPSVGEMWALNSIAASVIGGLALTGGIGNPVGAIVGAAIIGVIQNMIVLFGVSPYWQSAVSGLVVVLAISFDSITNMITSRKKLR